MTSLFGQAVKQTMKYFSQTSTQMAPYNMKNWFVGPNTDFWENISGTVKKICGTQIG